MKGDRASGSVRKVSWGNKFIKMIQFVMVLFLQMYLFIRGGYVPKKIFPRIPNLFDWILKMRIILFYVYGKSRLQKSLLFWKANILSYKFFICFTSLDIFLISLTFLQFYKSWQLYKFWQWGAFYLFIAEFFAT